MIELLFLLIVGLVIWAVARKPQSKDDPALRERRDNYAMKENTLPSLERREDLTHFFFWTAWATATERPAPPAPPWCTAAR